MIATSNFYIERLQQKQYTKWFAEFADWTHAVTVTCKPSRTGKPRAKSPTINATAHFVRVLNRRVLGRKNVSQGHRIACAGVYGTGVYQDNPHVHLAFQAPPNVSYDAMYQVIESAIKSTKGLGAKFDICQYTSDGWLTYMLDHGTDGLLVELISPAKH